MSNSVTYQVNLKVVGEDVVGSITRQVEDLHKSTQKATKSFGDCYKALLSISLAAEGLSTLEQGFKDIITNGVELNSQMAELSAITGVTGDGLKAIETAARQTAKTFGTDASANVESYKLVLSQLDPEIAKNAEAMKMMGDNINILSKQMGGDTVAATNVLTTSMNQFGISTENPIEAAKTMADMMNVMSSAAQAGSAELPQIQSALEQVGMVAKTTGLSFEETNAQIQILDKAGKKGSEGGVALRNVLTTLSEGRFTSKLAAQGLQQAGISVEYLANTSIPLTDRLKTLRKIQGDTALMTKVFGKENMAAAIAMINGADEAEALTEQITGTNSAMDQAEIIMGSYAEKMARTKAWWDDLKIAAFNFIEPVSANIQNLFSLFNILGQVAVSMNALKTIYDAISIRKTIDTIKTWKNTIATKANAVVKRIAARATDTLCDKLLSVNTQMAIGAVISRIQAGGIRSVAIAFGQATMGATAFQIALDALGIGLILAAIVGLAYGLKYLWDHSRRFNEEIGGIFYAAKAVFHNIGVFLQRLWAMVVKPIVLAWWSLFSWFWGGLWKTAKNAFNFVKEIIVDWWNTGTSIIQSLADFFVSLWNGIVAGAMWIWETLTSVFKTIWSVGVWVFQSIGGVFSSVWTGITDLFSKFSEWIDDTVVKPVTDMLEWLWDHTIGIFSGITDRMKEMASAVSGFFGKLFSSDDMESVGGAYQMGKKDFGEDYDKRKKEEKNAKKGDEDNPLAVVVKGDGKPVFDLKTDVPTTPTIGGVATEKAKKKGKGVGEKSDNGNKVQSLNVGKFMDNFNVYMNAANGIDKEQIRQAIQEVFYTAVADFTGATN